jgi:small conductance mechanosensitive channel
METLLTKTDYALQKLMDFAPILVVSILTLIIGFWLASKLGYLVRKALKSRGVDSTIVPFLSSMLVVLIKI